MYVRKPIPQKTRQLISYTIEPVGSTIKILIHRIISQSWTNYILLSQSYKKTTILSNIAMLLPGCYWLDVFRYNYNCVTGLNHTHIALLIRQWSIIDHSRTRIPTPSLPSTLSSSALLIPNLLPLSMKPFWYISTGLRNDFRVFFCSVSLNWESVNGYTLLEQTPPFVSNPGLESKVPSYLLTIADLATCPDTATIWPKYANLC